MVRQYRRETELLSRPRRLTTAQHHPPAGGRASLALAAGLALVAGLQALAGVSAADSVEARWAWVGAVTPTAATVKVRFPAAAAEPLLLTPDGAETLRLEPAQVEPVAGGVVATYAVSGLGPATGYRYRVGGIEGRFRTFATAPASFVVAFGSCARTGSEHPVFTAIAQRQPLLFLHTGDLHYEDTQAAEPGPHLAALERALDSRAQASLHRSTAFDWMWDDHDSAAKSPNTPAHRAAARRAYRLATPHYPHATDTLGHAFTIGRVRFIVTDARTGRDAARGTMLGDAQKAWFKAELRAATSAAALVVWVNSVPWIAPERAGADHWGGFSAERRELAALIEELGPGRLCMLSGDAHMLAIDDGQHNRYGPSGRPLFPIFHAGALDQHGSVKGGPYSHGAFPGGGQFGWMEIIDEGGDTLRIVWTGRNARDEVLVRHEFTTPHLPGAATPSATPSSP